MSGIAVVSKISVINPEIIKLGDKVIIFLDRESIWTDEDDFLRIRNQFAEELGCDQDQVILTYGVIDIKVERVGPK